MFISRGQLWIQRWRKTWIIQDGSRKLLDNLYLAYTAVWSGSPPQHQISNLSSLQFYKSPLVLPHRSTTVQLWSRVPRPCFLPIIASYQRFSCWKDSESTYKGNSLLSCFLHPWKHVRESNIHFGEVFYSLRQKKNSNYLIIPHTPSLIYFQSVRVL